MWNVNLVLGAFSGHYMHLSLDFYTSLRRTPSRLFMAVSQVRRRSTLSFFGENFHFPRLWCLFQNKGKDWKYCLRVSTAGVCDVQQSITDTSTEFNRVDERLLPWCWFTAGVKKSSHVGKKIKWKSCCGLSMLVYISHVNSQSVV